MLPPFVAPFLGGPLATARDGRVCSTGQDIDPAFKYSLADCSGYQAPVVIADLLLTYSDGDWIHALGAGGVIAEEETRRELLAILRVAAAETEADRFRVDEADLKGDRDGQGGRR